MTPDELADCIRRLAAYYPGDWDTHRQAVWATELLALDHTTARQAITAMARSERFPTVAAFHDHTHPDPNQVIVDGDCRFLPGIGWLGRKYPDGDTPERAALTAVPTATPIPRSINEARTALGPRAPRPDPDDDPTPIDRPRPMAALVAKVTPKRPTAS